MLLRPFQITVMDRRDSSVEVPRDIKAILQWWTKLSQFLAGEAFLFKANDPGPRVIVL